MMINVTPELSFEFTKEESLGSSVGFSFRKSASYFSPSVVCSCLVRFRLQKYLVRFRNCF